LLLKDGDSSSQCSAPAEAHSSAHISVTAVLQVGLLEVQASIQPQNAQKNYKYHSCASFAGENNSTCFAPAEARSRHASGQPALQDLLAGSYDASRAFFPITHLLFLVMFGESLVNFLGLVTGTFRLGSGTTRQALLMKNMLNCGITLSSRIALCSRDT
jgi:hypothetical protein